MVRGVASGNRLDNAEDPERARAVHFIAHAVNETINRCATLKGEVITGSVVAEALLICVAARLNEGMRRKLGNASQKERRDAVVELFDQILTELPELPEMAGS